MGFCQQKLKLLQVSGILPNPFFIYKYEVYDMERGIGFKVKNRCLKLSKHQTFKVVEPHDLPEEKNSGILKVSGYHLFQTAIEAFQESPESPAEYLVSKLLQNSFTLKIWFFLFWYNLCSLLRICSLTAMLNSKKMPNHKKFLNNFKKIYRLLQKANVIQKRLTSKRYKISYFITEWRHCAIVIHGKKHSFVLELYYHMFQNTIYNCPKIRYIPSYDDLNLKYLPPINKSAEDLVRLAKSTVRDMPNYNLLNSNCQNFVKNFLESINRESNKLEGEQIREILEQLDSKPLQDITYILLGLLYIYYDQIPDVFLPSTNSLIVVSILFLLMLMAYRHLSSKNDIFKGLVLLIALIIILYLYSKKSATIFHGFFLMLWLFIIRLLRLKPRYIALNFFLLALCLGFLSYEFLSEPFLPSVAIAAYTACFGTWSLVGNMYDHDLTVILPCVVVMIYFDISDHPIVCILFHVVYFMQLKNYSNQSFLESVLLVVTLLIREFCVSNSDTNTHSTHLILVYIMFIYVFVKIAYMQGFMRSTTFGAAPAPAPTPKIGAGSFHALHSPKRAPSARKKQRSSHKRS